MKKGEDYTGVTVSYMCHDGKGNYLMNKRSINCRDEHGTWDFGGGGVDFGISVDDTLKNELKEEYCIENFTSTFLGYDDLFRTHNDKPTHWVRLLFLVKVDRSEVKNGEPHKFDEINWFKIDNLPSPLHSMIPGLLVKYKHKL